MASRAVLMKTGLRPLNNARTVNTAHPKTIVYSARPMSHFSKSTQSTVKRPYQIRIALTNKSFNQKVNTAKGKFYTARPNSAVVIAVRANQAHPQKEDQGYVDSGCSRHMIRNMSYLSNFKDFDRGYVTFRGGAKGGKITSKGTLKTEDIELESTKSGPTTKLPILKLGEYEMWVSVPQTTQENGISVTKMSIPITTEEKTNKKNDVKARGLLLMTLPNEHQLTFSQYPNSKSMFTAIETRFGGNAATKKTQKTLLKQQYENSSASSGESLDSIFNRLQKIVSRLAILGVIIEQEDLNLNFLSSLPPEWNTHVVVWMNKYEVETMSIDDLYNNFKIVEQKVKKFVGTSSGGQNLAFMTAPTTSSTNDANTANDLEAMDLKWQLSLLSMRAKKYYQRTCKKIFINANDIAGAPKSKESQFRNQDNTRKQGNNEDKSSKAMLAMDGVGFDWSDMAEEQVQKNMALMAFSDSEVYTDKTCSKTCLKNYETLKKQCDDLLVKLNESEFKAATYKRGCKDYEINVLKSELEKVKQEKDGIDFKIEKFDKASKDLDRLLGSQITDKSKKGLGYSAVPPPYPLIYNRPNKLYLSYSGLDEFKEPEFKSYGLEISKQESNVVCDKESDNSKEISDESLVEEQVSHDKSSFVESLPNVDKETVFLVNKKLEFTKPENYEKPVKKLVRVRGVNAVKSSAYWVERPTKSNGGKPQHDDKGFINSGCSRHMTGNIAYLLDFKEFNGGYVAFGGGAYGGRITGKGTLKTDNLDFEDVYFVNELKFNLFSVSQMCDKKNYVLFTDTECLVLSLNFKLPDENQILLKIPRKDNMYSFDMKNIVPKESLTCLVAKTTLDESMLWHRRLSHIDFKNINKLVKDNLVRGLPTKRFENDQTCVACLKGKQHRASCKSKVLNPITKPLFMLHMDLFGPTIMSSLMHKKYCLVVTDDYKFKNKVLDDFCKEKGIKREYSVARTPQQNGVAKRNSSTLIEAARIMLADSKLPTIGTKLLVILKTVKHIEYLMLNASPLK
ncbi:putative ribonuclease H-like domain-containing protein [Tanacetum coccineum]|uniref:Ribonuclease H-like domain-containing protein n=1 Tax=Tanacetum coccineum TaxID=301880 RepID=A0ABQ5C4B4_9ASTR